MFENDSSVSGSPNQSPDANLTAADYVRMARAAEQQADFDTAMHLYVIAFDMSVRQNPGHVTEALGYLRQAWDLGITLKSRSFCEHIFEKLEPYMSDDEAESKANQLQELALERLREFGFSPEMMQDVADLITEDAMNGTLGGMFSLSTTDGEGRPINIEGISTHIALPHRDEVDTSDETEDSFEELTDAEADELVQALGEAADEILGAKLTDSSEDSTDALAQPKQASASSERASSSEKAGPAKDATSGAGEMTPSRAQSDTPSQKETSAIVESFKKSLNDTSKAKASSKDKKSHVFSYKDLVGFERAISDMQRYGIGLDEDVRYIEFIDMLSRRHGIDNPPHTQTILFRSQAREDANQFMAATVGELGVPALRMYMEEGPQGNPIICLMASNEFKHRLRFSQALQEGPAALVLEDIDLWGAPFISALDEMTPQGMALGRGVREAVSMVRQAVENPDIAVFASAAQGEQIDGFFYDVLDPIEEVFIDTPNATERMSVWSKVTELHPSLRFVDKDELVDVTKNLSRFEIYSAAREAVEDAYQKSVQARAYMPVTRTNVLDKIAALQPLDSQEYKQIEDAQIVSLREEIERMDTPNEEA